MKADEAALYLMKEGNHNFVWGTPEPQELQALVVSERDSTMWDCKQKDC